jgi:DNA-binding transcriptional LysR family regulator
VAIPIQRIDLKLLRVFRAIIRNGGFAAAQSELNTSLANISLQMKQLEEQLGVRICERGHRGFRLTPQGTLLAGAADKLLAEVDVFVNDITAIANPGALALRLGVVEHMIRNPALRIARAIASTKTLRPGVKIEITVDVPPNLEAQIKEGSIDVAVSWPPADSSRLVFTPLLVELFDLYCSKDHMAANIAPSSLELVRIKGSGYVRWSQLDLIASNDPVLAQTISSRTLESVAYLILSGLYIGYLPRSYAAPWIAIGELQVLGDSSTTLEVEVGLLVPKLPGTVLPSMKAQLLQKALIQAHRTPCSDK